VYILGVKSIGGIPSTALVGAQIVTVLNVNTFQYEVNVKAGETLVGGGNTVKIGRQAPFQLLFGTLIRNNIKEYNFIGKADKMERSFTINGYGKVTGNNDIAVTSIGYSNTDKDVSVAQAANKKVMDSVSNELKRIGIDDKDLQTDYSIYPDVQSYSTIIGRASPNSGSFGGAGTGSSNLASISLTLKDKEVRSATSYELADQIRRDLNAAEIPQLTINVSSPAGGPPAGAAFEAHISGDDLDVLTKIVSDLRPMLSSIPGAVNVDTSLKDSVPEYTFKLDPVALERNYLTAASVGSVLRTAISGIELTKIIKGEDEIKLIAIFHSSSIPDLASIQNLQVMNSRKQPVFLKDVSTIELKPAVNAITRIDQRRTVVLSSGADSTTNGPALLAAFQKSYASYQMPAGYSISYGGENEQNAESFASIVQAMIVAILLIVATLVIQFNSFRKALIVLVPIPLALIGVFIGMAIFDVSLGLPGLIGILALFGIVVKNSIILVDKINLNLKSGIPFDDAVADAGKSRLEAIFITSLCTIFGILPVTLSDEFWRALGGAVIFGLTLSSFLTLFLVPAFYLILMRKTEGVEE
jgi:multidrug efflux pump subunit AcrB